MYSKNPEYHKQGTSSYPSNIQDELVQSGSIWQRNFWDHIIKNKKEHDRITKYIKMKPKNWDRKQ